MTKDEYTHSSISFQDSLQPLYSFGRKYSHLSLPAGLKKESFTEGFYKAYPHTKMAVYILLVSEIGYDKMIAYVKGLLEDEKKWKYSVIGLAKAKRGIKTNRDHRQFCSQFVANCLLASGEIEIPTDPSLMRPMELIEIKGVTCIYKGEIKDAIGRHFTIDK